MVRHPWLAPLARPTVVGIRSTVRSDAAAWLIAAAFGLLVAVVLFTNGWRGTLDGQVSGGWNWSDLLVHVSIGASIVNGNFPPEVPYFAGVPLTYHWFADFHGAIASSVAGVDLIAVYFATSGLFASVMALLVWALALSLTGDRRVAAIATLLACLGGGMGWLRLVGDALAGGADYRRAHHREPVRQQLGGRLAVLPDRVRARDRVPAASCVDARLARADRGRAACRALPRSAAGGRADGRLDRGAPGPVPVLRFPATYVIVGLYVLTTGAWRATTARRDAALFLGPIVLAIPFVAEAIAQQGRIGNLRFVAGWTEARFRDGPLAVLFFYATNLGIPFVLALVAAITGRGLPNRRFLVAWLVALFLVPNVVVLSAVDFDMNKYFQMMWIAVAMLAAWLIRRWPKPAIAIVVALSAISPGLIAVWHATSRPVALTPGQMGVARWIEANTPNRAIFLTDAFINSPVDLAGRRRITTFGPYVSNLGYDPAPREADTIAAYCDGPEVAAEIMARYGATYALSSGGVLDCDDPEGTDFDASPRFESVYDVAGITVWRLVPT